MVQCWLAGLLMACGSGNDRTDDAPNTGSVDPTPTPTVPTPTETSPPFTPAAATAHRLVDAEWRNGVEDLFGVRFDGTLPGDYTLHGYTRVGASELGVGTLDEEQYETAAWWVAGDVVPDVPAGETLLGCDPDAPGCIRVWAADVTRRAWRRPATVAELDAFEDLYAVVTPEVGDLLALQGLVSTVLQSPNFLFRVELGEPDPLEPDRRRFTDHELAGRLASFVTASVPDHALMDAADAGLLTDPVELLAQAERLLATERGREAMAAFFAETLELYKLDTVSKDAALYPEFTEGLQGEMAGELLLLFKEIALDRDADFGDLLTTNETFVGPELAALYGVPGGVGPVLATLTEDRGGVLGRAAVATIHSHNTLTSPTHRGKFARGRLLCHDIPPPPPGIVASLDETVTDGTMRDRLAQHATDPACAPCHEAMDPLGFALEHLDPIGRWRDQDNGLPIDATGEVDGAPFDGAVELGAAIAAHPDFPGCVALQLYRHANGQAERYDELVEVDAVTDLFVEDGRRFTALVLALVASDAFRTATAPVGEACEDAERDMTRPCSTACGTGVETCLDGAWRHCTAAAPAPETCNGTDDDCDGLVDQSLEQSCDAAGVLGTQTCDAGAWAACEPPGVVPAGPTDEVCNGLDDDLDGAIDEEMEVSIPTVTGAELVAAHPGCDLLTDAMSGDCRTAYHLTCAAQGCGTATGFGPVDVGTNDATLSCMDGAEGVLMATTYTELTLQHPSCNQGNPWGPDCNAAINRWCGVQGLRTGFGPVSSVGDAVDVVCTPNASVYVAHYSTELITHDPTCDGTAQRSGPQCNRAFHEYCRAGGFETGHGPLENAGDDGHVACMGVL